MVSPRELDSVASHRQQAPPRKQPSARSLEHYGDAALYEATFRQQKHDVAYFVRLAQEHGGPVLEYGAGAGRVTLALAAAGVEVVAVDKSAAMLALLRERRAALPREQAARIRVVSGDMKKKQGLGQFPLILATFNVVGHLETFEEMAQWLARVREHLAPGGLLVFDVPLPAPEELEAEDEELFVAPRFRHPVTGQRMRQTERFEYDPISQVLLVESEFSVVGQPGTWKVPLVLRQWFPRELEALLNYEGFASVQLFSDYSDCPLMEGADMVVVHARLK